MAPAREEKNMEKDLVEKRCLSDNRRYADLINGFVFRGRQILHEKDLKEMDTQTGIWERRRYWKKRKARPKYRDLLRKAALGVNFAVIGVENQEEVNYLMPLRSMGYDVGEYERQAAWAKKKVKKEKGISKAEFLSGFKKSDRLCPCITLVLFFGKEWDGGRDLHGILDFTDIPPELKEMVSNYPLHLLEVRKLERTDIFRTDLRQIFDIIRYSENKEMLRKTIESDSAYREMDEDAYDMAVEYVKAEELTAVKKFYQKEGKVDMCKALKELIEDGRKEGQEKGREEGEAKILVKSVESVMEKFHVDFETACDGVGITASEYYKAKSISKLFQKIG